jgi:large subunit ribosomal protein L31e
MANKTEDKKKEKVAKLEREYNIPVRKEVMKAPKYKRAKKAMTAVREFLVKNMKCADVKLGPQINKYVWDRGIKYPPHHVKVKAIRTEDNIVHAELVGFDYVVKKKAEKQSKTKLEEAAERLGMKSKKGTTKEEKLEEALEEKREEAVKEKAEKAKEILKEEIDELKHEHLDKEKVMPNIKPPQDTDKTHKSPRGSQKMGNHEHSN